MSSLVIRVGPFSARCERRTMLALAGLVAVGVAVTILGLCFGGTWLPPGEVLAALAGHGDSVLVVQQWRLPRVVAALVFGAALGLAGGILQNLTRNSLGSPDIIGLDAGAYTGALIAITVVNGAAATLAAGSVLGGLAAAAVIYLLSRDSGLSTGKMIIIGIAVNAILTAVNSWIVLRAELDVAIAATGWNAGSLDGVDWDEVVLPFVIIGVLAAALVVVSQAMRQATLGDALAVTSGVALNRLRLVLVIIGVGCSATVTAVAGPIVFVALAAPQIGRRVAGDSAVPMLPAALTGAVLLLTADIVAQLLLAPIALPVGVVTTVIGGCYLIWLLIREMRRS